MSQALRTTGETCLKQLGIMSEFFSYQVPLVSTFARCCCALAYVSIDAMHHQKLIRAVSVARVRV